MAQYTASQIRSKTAMAKKVVKHHFGKTFEKIEFKPAGKTNFVFDVKTKDGNYIVRIATSRTKINNFIKNDLLSVLLNNKKVIGDLISSTVKSWDGKEVSEKLELEIGKDLQYIRINGTLVGGCIGLVIYGVEQLYHFIF